MAPSEAYNKYYFKHRYERQLEGAAGVFGPIEREQIRRALVTTTSGSETLFSGSSHHVGDDAVTYDDGPSPTASNGTLDLTQGWKGFDSYAKRALARPYSFHVDDPNVSIGSYVFAQTHLGEPSRLMNNSLIGESFGLHRAVVNPAFLDTSSYIELDFHQHPYFRVLQTKTFDLTIDGDPLNPESQNPGALDSASGSTGMRLNTRAKIFRKGIYTPGSYDAVKSAYILPFTVYSSSVDTGYIKGAKLGTSLTSSLEFNNFHQDRGGWTGRHPSLQGPFTEKFVGGLQYRHVALNMWNSYGGQDQRTSRPEGWHLSIPSEGETSVTSVLLLSGGSFDSAATIAPNTNIAGGLEPAMGDSVFLNSEWTAVPADSAGDGVRWYLSSETTRMQPQSGPTAPQAGSTYIYYSPEPSDSNETAYLNSPEIDATEASALTNGSNNLGLTGSFYYSMYSDNPMTLGTLSLQIQVAGGYESGEAAPLSTQESDWTDLSVALVQTRVIPIAIGFWQSLI